MAKKVYKYTHINKGEMFIYIFIYIRSLLLLLSNYSVTYWLQYHSGNERYHTQMKEGERHFNWLVLARSK